MEAANVTRAAIYLALFLAATPSWAQVDNDGQEDAARQAAEAAKAALSGADKKASEKKAPEKKAPEKKAPEKKAPEKKAPAKKAAKPTAGAVPNWAKSPGTAAKTPGHELKANWDAANSAEIRVGFPWVEHHGAFRVRADVLYNLDLDTYQVADGAGSSPVRPPFTQRDTSGNQHPETDVNGDGTPDHTYRSEIKESESLTSANMRFRYAPTLHISEDLRIKTTVDIFDNMVLGSTPDGAPSNRFGRADVPLQFFSEGQRPPEAGVNGWRDSIRVKHAWGEWSSPAGLVVFGRTQSHWGLGMVTNGGGCLDCDYGDAIDRIMMVRKLFETYVSLSYDFPSEGFVGFSGDLNHRTEATGQAYDYDQRDDVTQYTVALFQRPHTPEERAHRARDLNELRKPVIDFGLYNIIRSQIYESTYDGPDAPAIDDSNYSLLDIDAFSYTPDLWIDFQYRPSADTAYRLQLEAAAVFGSIEELPSRAGEPLQRCTDPTVTDLEACESVYEPRRRDLFKMGYALEFDAEVSEFRWGVHHGLATGDPNAGFGIYGRSSIPESTAVVDTELSEFIFDRDYHVDQILFRQILGSVTNATYVKPYFGWDFVKTADEAWGVTLSGMYAMALEKKATPGKESPLGLEFNLELAIREHGRFLWNIQYAFLVPMEGLDYISGDQRFEAAGAQTLQMNVGLEF